MKNLIVIEGDEKYQYDDLQSLVKNFINEDYYEMSKKEKENEIEKKTIANTMLEKIKTIKLEKGITEIDENAFILYDEITFILSLAKFNKIVLLEKTDADIFGKYIDKQNFEDNYIIINKFADEIMKKYLNNKWINDSNWGEKMVSVEYSEAIVEVLDILYNSEDSIEEKIPKELIEFWQNNKSTTYKPNLDHSKSLNEMNLKNKTKSLITMIYLNYLCDDVEKEKIQLILKNNEEKHQKELKEKYNSDNLFKKNPHESVVKENVFESNAQIIEYKENMFKRIINKIKKILYINWR